MVDNQHKQITGYRDLPQHDLDLVNEIKAVEVELARLWQKVQSRQFMVAEEPQVDRRWLAVARTHFQEGFSALVRSVTRPTDPFDPQ